MGLEKQFRNIAVNRSSRPPSREERFGSSEAGNSLQDSLNPDFEAKVSVYSLSVSWQDYQAKFQNKECPTGDYLRAGNTDLVFYYFLRDFFSLSSYRLDGVQGDIIIDQLAQNQFNETNRDYDFTTTYYFDKLKALCCDQKLQNGNIIFKKETRGGNDNLTMII